MSHRFILRYFVIASTLFAATNAFGDQPLRTGLVMPSNWKTLAPWQQQFYVEKDELPRFYDWRWYAQGLPKVNLQAWNDCWAQGTVGVLESLIKIHYGEEVRMSVQEVISCSGEGSAARGGYFAHNYHKARGGVTNNDFPYVGKDVRCKTGLQGKEYLAQWGYVGQSNRKPTVLEIKQAMMEHGPIGVTITANGSLQNFKGSGVFKGCTSGQTNHIVVLVGWNDDEGDNGVWFMRNSWGTGHGQDGYAKIPFNCSRVGEVATWADLKIPEMGGKVVKAIDAFAY